MVEGEGYVAPLEYSYFNYCRFYGGRGDGKAKFRRNDNEFFWLIDACMRGDNDYFQGIEKKGVLEVGRRRSGKSAKIGWAQCEWLRQHKNISIVLTHKNEKDGTKFLFEKVHFPYENLPVPIKPSSMKVAQDKLHLGKIGKDTAGNRVVEGRNTKIVVKPSKATAIEGETLFAWCHDEFGKTKDLLYLVDMTLPALNDEEGFHREGFVYIGGVAGDFGDFPDAQKLWDGADQYDLVRWFSPGWYGRCCDEFGNENVEQGVREILTLRHKIFIDKSMTAADKQDRFYKHIQQFPLTVEEAFLGIDSKGFNAEYLKAQQNALLNSPVEVYGFNVNWKHKGVLAQAVPNQLEGKVRVIEPPMPGCKYIAGSDPHGTKIVGTGSDGVLWIFKLRDNSLSPLEREHLEHSLINEPDMNKKMKVHLKLGHIPVAYYLDNGLTSEFAETSAAICNWYQLGSNQKQPVKILIEVQPSPVFDYLLLHYPKMLMNSPIKPNKPPSARDLARLGLKPDAYWVERKFAELEHFVNFLCDKIYFLVLLDCLLKYNPENQKTKFDMVDALGVVLIMAADPRIKEWNSKMEKVEELEEFNSSILGYRRMN